MSLHPRIAEKRLRSLLRQFPAVAILGARQVGKSTLARIALPSFDFLDLEDPGVQRRLSDDAVFVLEESRRLVIDEAQRLPEIFPALRVVLDRDPKRRVVLLGSASPALVRELSESLTGRVGILDMGGLSVAEAPWEKLWLRGSYPRVQWSHPRATPQEWYPAYLRTCIEQDIPQLGFRVSARKIHDALLMLAHHQGGLCNLSELGGSLGLNYHSVAHLIDILEGIFLVRRLPPYFANIGKRLVKSPKVYLRDTGMLHSLLGMGFARKSVVAHPKAGSSFETFCIEQLLFHARLADPTSEAFFYRTHSGTEVDLLLRLRGELLPIEIKLGSSVPDLKGLRTCMADLALPRGYVVNLAKEAGVVGRGIWMGPLESCLKKLRLLPSARG
ncbi:MAG: ATP-binding protein [Deltaproteobacteria bacterium]